MTGAVHVLVPIDRLVAMLRDNCERLVRELLPLGRRDGPEWREASKSHGGLGDSLSVHIHGGARQGLWAFHGGTDAGDLLDLIAYLKFNGNKRDAIAWAKAWLGIDAAAAAKLQETPAAPRAPVIDANSEIDIAKRRASAHAIYLAGSPIDGTPVARYLACRGLDITRLRYPLNALRFHPELWDRHTRRRWPAMVAAITATDGKFIAAHMTYLEPLADGSVRKAPIADPSGKPAAKRVLGSFRGGAIRLWRGQRIDPNTGEIKQARRLAQCKAGQWVDITEGIEDGLTVAIADPDARVLVAVSVSNLAAIRLPECVEGVVIWRQNDAPGSKAEAAVNRAIDQFKLQGKRVADCRPPAGIKDANDMAQVANAVRQETA